MMAFLHRWILGFGLVFAFTFPSHAQSVWPYQLRKGKEWGLMGSGVATNLSGLVLQSKTPGLSPLEIAGLNPGQIYGFDRVAIEQHSSLAHKLSFGTPILAGLSNAALLVDSTPRNHLPELLLMGTEGALLTLGINQTVKATVLRSRPYVYNPAISWDEKGQRDARFSFFSQHTSFTGYFSFFAAKAYHDLHPNSHNRWLPWAGAGFLTATTGYLRVKAGRHFPSDVIVGGIFGAAMGWGVLEVHRTRTRSGKNTSLSSGTSTSSVRVYSVGNGVGVEWRF